MPDATLSLRRHDDVVLFAFAEEEVFAEEQVVARHGFFPSSSRNAIGE
ncbi:MAG TPA: hypothetical protein VFV96_02585 [Verrucomicrobiae bacterium]|nr:hypothetical protein [Verrucomicrobiae bacterium]